MKKMNSLLMGLLLFSTSAIAQGLRPGVYHAQNGSYPATITTNGNTITYKDYRQTTEFTLKSGNKYTAANTTEILLVTATDRFTHAEENGPFKREFTLYAPSDLTPEEGVIAFEVDGATYFGVPSDLPEVVGIYQYNQGGTWGAPIVELKADGSGQFQPHGVNAIPIRWLIESDPKGNIQKTGLANGGHRMLLVVQFGKGGDGNYPEGTYKRYQLDIYPGDKSVILGERVKVW